MEVNKKRIITGRVVSKKMEKTVTVKVERTYRHPLVGKVVFSYKKFHIHDPLEQAQVGDVVEFYEGRPVSKTKYMYLHRIVTSAQK